ncbi:OmpA family protein [Microbulbifer thermotolerans]|uniref:Peptidoglycan-associated lipoprotein n=1 Tax=Microbulbifer thermotolerans TaxID=252514 RepID=A0A143HJS8_MICTH|nr:OmpA family protein [Microbulbifer thermotolerans]AMX01756.1 peptidoglycan-associated lipoprotein [Microbulbifer thermotolerans]MCX2779530.1 OmpA family protein [Microbulbifer thermotolerans]MCX2783366.1 OmpA family protein [Microbulbifer thermotolerans]MCX2793402.1 OmpA family protein [Microbulbifer thermotolerans]MCX2801343.1 OmpA family protein [Microbulbifer thermotolerans]
MLKSVKTGLGLAFVLAVMSGCSSTDTETSGQQQEVVDQTPEPVVEAPVTETVAPLDNVVYFDFDQSLLKPETRDLLIQHAERLRGTSTQVRLEGHADELGTREYNLALGERRANAVRDFLVLQGVDAANLEVISYGEERPAVPGSSESARAMNRRVEIN